MKLSQSLKMLTLVAMFGMARLALAVDVKGIEVDFATKLTPPESDCVQLEYQPRTNNPVSQARDQFQFTAKAGTTIVAPAPGIVIRDIASQFLVFHGLDAQGNTVLSAFSKAINDTKVTKGQVLKRGDVIGEASTSRPFYFSALVSGIADHQVLLDSLMKLAFNTTNVPASYFLFPISQIPGKSTVTEFAAFDPAKDYGEGDWPQTKKFTGFTWPLTCSKQ